MCCILLCCVRVRARLLPYLTDESARFGVVGGLCGVASHVQQPPRLEQPRQSLTLHYIR
jgi:hypothetical protein